MLAAPVQLELLLLLALLLVLLVLLVLLLLVLLMRSVHPSAQQWVLR